MPSLGSHLASARLLAGRLAHPAIEADRGSFYLGSTAPDIRVITRLDRERYHFFALDDFESQDSVARMFEEHPSLRNSARLDEATRAFMAGYLTHLVMDQDYIETIYRVYFGPAAWGDDPRGNVLDRVLQYEMDRRERESPETMSDLRDSLYGCALDVDCGFIDRAMLEQWRDVSASLTEYAPDWERFSYIASRHLKRAGVTTDAEYQAFLEQIPELLQETLRSVGTAKVEAFFEIAQQRTVVALREYLG